MKSLIIFFLTFFTVTSFSQVHVRGYTKSNGTYVAPHMRSSPNSTPIDNYSYPGNTNPYTGKTATGNPDTYLKNYNNSSSPSSADVWVDGYYRSDGTYVKGYYRTAPNGNPYDNYSFPGNRNPYKGKTATGNPDIYLNNYYGTSSSTYYSNNGEKSVVLDDGTTVEFSLRDGKINGPLKSYYVNGNLRRTGLFINGLENGLFKEYDEKNHLNVEYLMKSGKYNGILKSYYPNGQLKRKGTFLDDIENGNFFEYSEDGIIEAEYSMKDGVYNGPFKTYYPNGQLRRKGTFLNEKENGNFFEYDEDGNIEVEYFLKYGEYNGLLRTFYPNGQLKMKGTFLNDKKNGTFIEYNEDGSKDMEYSMFDGTKNGIFKFYSDNKLSHSVTYKNDILDGPRVEYYYNEEDGHLFLKQYGNFLNDKKNGPWKLYLIENNKERLFSQITYLNDLKNGKFQDVNGDSLILGTYKNDKLNGSYKVYIDFVSKLFGGVMRTDTSKLTLISEGNYKDGLKSGYWKNYFFTNSLSDEGAYTSDLKSGTWRYYYANFGDDNGNSLPYSGKLFLIENYINGKLNGTSTRYSYLNDVKYPCTQKENSNNPGDTCTRQDYIKILETANYLNDKLNGSYELRDSLNQVFKKGNYSNDMKSNEWLERYYSTDINDKPYFIYYKGNYQNDKRTGKWIKYYTEGVITETISYKEGFLNGDYVEFNSYNKPFRSKQYINDELKEVVNYDSLGNNPILKFEIYDKKNDGFKCRNTEYNNQGTYSQEFWIAEDGEINDQLFDLYFYLKTGKLSGGQVGYRDGEFISSNLQNHPIITGKYFKDSKIDLWSYYYYDQKVKIVSNYIDGEKKDEKYLTLDNLPFSGEFTYKDNDLGIKEVRKIKKGLRNGRTQFIDIKTDKIIKKENYKKGKLK